MCLFVFEYGRGIFVCGYGQVSVAFIPQGQKRVSGPVKPEVHAEWLDTSNWLQECLDRGAGNQTPVLQRNNIDVDHWILLPYSYISWLLTSVDFLKLQVFLPIASNVPLYTEMFFLMNPKHHHLKGNEFNYSPT